MDLMKQYMDNQIIDYNLWIAKNKDVVQVLCLRIEYLKPHPDYKGFMTGKIILEDWVVEEANANAKDWRKKPRMILATNGHQQLKDYSIVWDDLYDNMDGTFSYEFNCKEDTE